MEWLTALLAAVFIACVGYLFDQRQRRNERKDEQFEAVAALRYELQSNLEWMDDILESRLYLRDEAWNHLKNNGYISYLPAPIPKRVISTYEKIHLLNEQIHMFKDAKQDFELDKAQRAKAEAENKIVDLIKLLDVKFPKIGKNFAE